MAGHSKFKNIQHRKGAQDKKRSKIFTRLVREIVTAGKVGSPDPEHNPRLRTAIQNARSMNLPKDRIDKALAQLNFANDLKEYFEIRYEGYAINGIAVIVEAVTDNKNRTASDVRSVFTKFGGNLGETGSVSFMFDNLGIIQYSSEDITNDKIFEISIEAGAEDVETDDLYHYIYTKKEDFSEVLQKVTEKIGAPEEASIGWKPQNKIRIEDEDKLAKIIKMIDALEDFDDVEKTYTNLEY